MNNRNNMWYNLSLLSQLAISFLTPIFLMIFVCTWRKSKFALGDWIIIAGILLGMGSGISSVWVYLKKSIKDAEKQQQEYENQFR
ncbi:MAG: AtpZ/AtpI family protein [Oscillospiraceae bacterium]|nr:AtpZ/AtpI family protein [Oscillospiraceae bacterium]